jgi:hypothetical protein
MAAIVPKPDDIASQGEGDAGARTHRVALDLFPEVPPEVPVGTSIGFKVRVSCGDGIDLRGGCVEITASERVVAAPALIECRDGCNETAAVSVRAPDRPGAYDLTVVFPRQKIGGDIYEECALPISFRTRPHRTSLAVWAVPSPVPIGGRFSVMVGAKSSGACDLQGASVEISDEAGVTVGQGTLGQAPWPGTSGLYWAEIGLTAPPGEGTFSWSAAFPAQELNLSHDGSSATFGFAAVRRPEHRLTIEVTQSEPAAPLADVQVALGPWRAATDAAGMACLEVPAGHFILAVWKSGFEAAPQAVAIARDIFLQVEMVRLAQDPTVWG